MMQAMPAPRSLKEKQRQEREALILQTAEAILTEKGYHETSMDEIAARVGVAKGTVYLHFPSKEELVIAIFERSLQQVLQGLEEVFIQDGTNRAKLEAVFRFFYDSSLSQNAHLFHNIYSSTDLQRLLLTRKETMRQQWENVSLRIGSLLEAGKTTGEFDATIPTTVMVNTFFSLLSPRSYEHLIIEQKMLPQELVKHLEHMYFKGIAHS